MRGQKAGCEEFTSTDYHGNFPNGYSLGCSFKRMDIQPGSRNATTTLQDRHKKSFSNINM